jgi:hypothetical protein
MSLELALLFSGFEKSDMAPQGFSPTKLMSVGLYFPRESVWKLERIAEVLLGWRKEYDNDGGRSEIELPT